MTEFKPYRRITNFEFRPLQPHETRESLLAAGVIVEAPYVEGPPETDDLIARHPIVKCHQFLVSRSFFERNFRPVLEVP